MLLSSFISPHPHLSIHSSSIHSSVQTIYVYVYIYLIINCGMFFISFYFILFQLLLFFSLHTHIFECFFSSLFRKIFFWHLFGTFLIISSIEVMSSSILFFLSTPCVNVPSGVCILQLDDYRCGSNGLYFEFFPHSHFGINIENNFFLKPTEIPREKK